MTAWNERFCKPSLGDGNGLVTANGDGSSGDPWTSLAAATHTSTGVQPGQRVNIHTGSYTPAAPHTAAGMACNMAGTDAAGGCCLRGVENIEADPLVPKAFPVDLQGYTVTINEEHWWLDYIDVSSDNPTATIVASHTSMFTRCTVTNTTSTGDALSTGSTNNAVAVLGCRLLPLSTGSGYGIKCSMSYLIAIGNTIYVPQSGYGVYGSSGMTQNVFASVIGNTFKGQGLQHGTGVLFAASMMNAAMCNIYGNTMYNLSKGIYYQSAYNATNDLLFVAVNNILYDCMYGITGPATNKASDRGINNAYMCTAANRSATLDRHYFGDIQLTADPFVDAAGGDFTLNDVPGGGAACRAAGFPAAIDIDAVIDNYLDLGALQAEAATAAAHNIIL